MAYEWAVPGAQVVCIDDMHLLFRRKNSLLNKGKVYIVKRFCLGCAGDPSLQLADGNIWDIVRFRPLITRSQEHDVALFAPILHGQPVGA